MKKKLVDECNNDSTWHIQGCEHVKWEEMKKLKPAPNPHKKQEEKRRFTLKLDNVAGMPTEGGVILIDGDGPFTYERIIVEEDHGIEFNNKGEPIAWHGKFKRGSPKKRNR